MVTWSLSPPRMLRAGAQQCWRTLEGQSQYLWRWEGSKSVLDQEAEPHRPEQEPPLSVHVKPRPGRKHRDVRGLKPQGTSETVGTQNPE